MTVLISIGDAPNSNLLSPKSKAVKQQLVFMIDYERIMCISKMSTVILALFNLLVDLSHALGQTY